MGSDNREFDAVCRFGPGGDYVSDWPGGNEESIFGSPSKMTKLLSSLHEIISAVTCSQAGGVGDAARSSVSFETISSQNINAKGHLQYAAKSKISKEPSNASPNAVASGDRSIRVEPLLFADDRRTGRGAGHKPKHRIRAYSRTAKKSHARSQSGQGTLFDVNYQSARTA